MRNKKCEKVQDGLRSAVPSWGKFTSPAFRYSLLLIHTLGCNSPPPTRSPCRRDFPHLQFSLNGGVQSAAEARSAILYDGPWPTPGHVESRLKLLLPSPQENGAAAAEAGAAPQQTPRGTTSQEGEGLQQACVSMVAVAGCGIGGDCVDDGDRLQQHQGEGVSREAGTAGEGTAGMAEAAVAESVPPIVSHAPISADDGLIEGVMIGRAAYNDPWGCLGDADRLVFGEQSNACSSRREVRSRGMRALLVHGELGRRTQVRCTLSPSL